MKIEALVQKSTGTREILGLVKEVDGLKALSFNTRNLQGEKLVFVDLELDNGEEHRLFCSKSVSQRLREKEISRGMLLNFPIVKWQDEESDRVSYFIQLPDGGGGNKVSFAIEALQAEEYEAAPVKWEDLIA